MKKLILLLLCTATLGLVSCKKDTIVNNILPRTISYDIPTSAWKTSDGGRSYFTEVNVPENNDDFNQSGGVIVSMAFDANKSIFDGLPNVYQGLSYQFSSEPNYVVIYVDGIDGQVISPPSAARVKIVLVDSELID
ncbi:hypothetical protein [Pedobacter heparinus]|uniref:hypothetical protein n=1 Tax=Pedobacter heparinus TaxID=984 RepID=UPI002930B52A|nr:hypothetical protein [Pedobacter heparinus]